MLVWTSLIAGEKRRSLLSFLGGLLVALVVFHLARFYGFSPLWTATAAITGLFALRSGAAALLFLLRHPFRAVEFGLSEAAAPGGEIRAVLRVEARRPATIRAAGVVLTAERRGSGVEEQVHADARELALDRRLGASGRLEVGVALPIPEGGPFSYRSFEGSIRWFVRARVETEGHGISEETLEVLVAPPPPAADGA